MAVGGLVVLVAHAFPHAAEPGRAALVVVGRVAGDLGVGTLVVALPRLDAIPVEIRGGVGLRDLHVGALAGLLRADERGQDADRAEGGTGGDADVGLVGDAAEPLVVDNRLQRARPRVVRDSVARQVPVRAGRAVAGDRAHDDRGIELAQTCVPEPALLEEPGAHRLDDDV